MELNTENIISICQKLNMEDTYSCSPVYYLMTCRKKGYIYKYKDNFIAVSLHPNTDDCVLIFHLFDENNTTYKYNCTEELAKSILLNNPEIKRVRISRLTEKMANSNTKLLIEENILDWKYPVHILNIDELIQLKGKGYSQIRQRLNQLSIELCKSESIKINEDNDIIIGMVKHWIEKFPYSECSIDDLLEPTKKLLSLMKDDRLCLHGQIIYYNGIPSAYCIWEERGTVANAFAMSADREIAGLAEYNIVEACRLLREKGIQKLNIGGSETEGLNRYKKKFNPVESINLYTWEVKL